MLYRYCNRVDFSMFQHQACKFSNIRLVIKRVGANAHLNQVDERGKDEFFGEIERGKFNDAGGLILCSSV